MSTTVNTRTEISLPLEPLSRTVTQGHPARGTTLISVDADQTVRWTPGERLDHYFEERCDAVPPNHPAVVAEDGVLTFRELDARANQTARYLQKLGLKAGDRIAVLFDKSLHSYVALLGILKMGAAYVPLDPSFPADRIGFILDDAEAVAIASVSAYEAKLAGLPLKHVYHDMIEEQLDAEPSHRLEDHEKPPTRDDELFYIIYTSGTTGKPKGVAINHSGICNFVRVAGEVYGYRQDDRCYQGMSLAFDFHVEDLWTPLIAGATLIAGRSGGSLFGADLHAFLTKQRVTVLPCVPTLWATLEDDLPDVRIIQLSGEAVPHHLVARWHRPGRRILNAYGPTECSVSSTLRVLEPDRPVTVGVPLPTYTAVILDEHRPALAEAGAIGEIGIAGVCLAVGYLNRKDLTEKKFVPDFLGLPNNPSGRIYRTGDYGRITDDGELEFHGRIDTQVKLRGYRIELGEIEAVLAQDPSVAHAVVNPFETAPGVTELVAYYTRKQGAPELSIPEVAANLRRQLPPYMVPGYLEELAFIPMTSNDKADRRALPAPRGPRLAVSTGTSIPPRTATERLLAEALMDIMNIESVSVTDDFFKDLGAHSLLMARFGAEIRKRMDLASVSMRELYLHPNLEALALRLDALTLSAPAATGGRSNEDDFYFPPRRDYYLCGTLQLLVMLAASVVTVGLFALGVFWVYAALPSYPEAYLRVVLYAMSMFVLYSIVPVALKWLLIGRWKAEAIPIWSMRYLRFWVVKSSIRVAPMGLTRGPLRNIFLRMLGAKIGAHTVLQSNKVPVTTDLLSIGANSVLAKDSIVQGYKAQSNRILIGRIDIGSHVSIGEAAVVDINTVMEDDTQLAFASSLHEGQRVPRGQHFHGSPAVETATDYCVLEERDCSSLRRATYAVLSLLAGFVLGSVPFLILIAGFPSLWDLVAAFERSLIGNDHPVVAWLTEVTLFSLTWYFGFLVLGLVVIGVIPRVLNLFLREGRTYVLYGFHYTVQHWISRICNNMFYDRLFGESSAVVYYLSYVGYRLNTIIQTGSNFGMSQKAENPFLVDIGTGTMVSGGVKFVNETMSSDAFKVADVVVGERNYLGNYLHIPSGSAVGENCLLATKALTPVDGPIRENTGLLGSPAFEIPRATERDVRMARIDPDEAARLLHAKNRHNFVTALLYLAHTWFLAFIMSAAVDLVIRVSENLGLLAVHLVGGAAGLIAVLWMWFVERAAVKFGRLQPMIVPLLHPYFWFHERHWKLSSLWLLARMFAGTPVKNVISRMEGIRMGRMVFDDGAEIDENTLVEFGDYTNLNSRCVIQPHSLEEGVFKSGRVRLGTGCTLGSAANLHYDVTVEDFVVIEANAFVMKGETLESGATWIGNPAQSTVASLTGGPARGDEIGARTAQ
jgi:non-ribosomal peptide synthetase-like protein